MKKYRYLIHRRYLRDHLYEQAVISKKFALLPLYISGKWILFREYYSLKIIESSIVFGGQITVRYSTVSRKLSYFSFKNLLKKEGIIKNLYKHKINYQKKFETYPKWFQEFAKGTNWEYEDE